MADFEVRPVEKLLPPYSYYNAVRTFVQRYIDAGMPDDASSILDSYGSTAKHHVRSTLRSLRFIDENNQATALLKQFARTSGIERNDLFRQVLIRTYPYLLGPEAKATGFDALTASREELMDKFREAGVEAKSTQERCADFFRGAIRDAGWGQDLSRMKKPQTNAGPSLGGDALDIVKDEMSFSGPRVYTLLEAEPPPLPQNGPPRLPDFNPSWSTQTQEKWIEMRYLEVTRK